MITKQISEIFPKPLLLGILVMIHRKKEEKNEEEDEITKLWVRIYGNIFIKNVMIDNIV